MVLNDFFELSQTFLRLRNRNFHRAFLQTCNLDSSRFSIIVGQRGVGKTTAMIQHLLARVQGDIYSDKALYIQADHFLLHGESLYAIADAFYKLGGELFCIDEIHKYPNWSLELKSMSDTFPKLSILASGSSALAVNKGSHDLSRRALVYRMHGMSFREYIGMRYGLSFDSLLLETLLATHQQVADAIVQKLDEKGLKILALFSEYLRHGYYPYFQEYQDIDQFFLTLEQNIRTTLESDLPAIYSSLQGTSIRKIQKLLAIIASLVPFTPDLKALKHLLDIGDERTLKTYLGYLEEAGVILTANKTGKGLRLLEKPAKIYLNNPNLYYALSKRQLVERGAIRETFLFNMLHVAHSVSVPSKGDFLIEDQITIEVGGKNKGTSQIIGLKKAWLAVDDIEIGHGQRVPLWLFGFLY
jgi:predicted AAA+ superfamily ATPase